MKERGREEKRKKERKNKTEKKQSVRDNEKKLKKSTITRGLDIMRIDKS